jgi:hypothetical protein
MSEGDPVAWLLIEHGWDVVDESGEHYGKIEEVVGDRENDIFNGLKIVTHLLGKAEYVPAESVGEITEGRVQLSRGQ